MVCEVVLQSGVTVPLAKFGKPLIVIASHLFSLIGSNGITVVIVPLFPPYELFRKSDFTAHLGV